jgi:multisubunit Na+/H+ antiporter MnhC subunit
MRAIILTAIIVVAIIALLFVINARLNRRNPELEDYPRKPDGADDVWWTGGGPGS